ncbi:MAG: hypothetical protein GXX86_11770, partial [Propionibacterium sp.]|nr:hypothetical protein [Propionibacterium sp.]
MRRLAVVLAAALALTACGGSDADTQPAATPPEPAATSTPPTSPESSPEPSPAEPTTAPATTSSAPTTSAPATPTAAPSPSYPADPMEWRLTTGGWGPVRIGQPLPADLNLDVEPAWECIGAIIHTHGEQRVEYWIDPDKGDSITGLY